MLTLPAISGAEPCTASARAIPASPILQLQKNSNAVRKTELYYGARMKIFKYLGVKPKPPTNPAQRSLIMSP